LLNNRFFYHACFRSSTLPEASSATIPTGTSGALKFNNDLGIGNLICASFIVARKSSKKTSTTHKFMRLLDVVNGPESLRS
jgi:hypothetical protein